MGRDLRFRLRVGNGDDVGSAWEQRRRPGPAGPFKDHGLRGGASRKQRSQTTRGSARLGTGTCQSPVEPAEPAIHPSTTVRTRRHAACRNIWNRGVSGEVVKENVQGVVTVAMIGHSIRPSWIGLERHHGPDTMSKFFLADPSGPVSLDCPCLVANHHVARSWGSGDSMDSLSRTRWKMNSPCSRQSSRLSGEEGFWTTPNLATGHSFHAADQVRINKFLLGHTTNFSLPSPTGTLLFRPRPRPRALFNSLTSKSSGRPDPDLTQILGTFDNPRALHRLDDQAGLLE